MKKITALALALLMFVTVLSGCASSASPESSETESKPAETAESAESTESTESADDYKLVLKLSHVFSPDEQLYKSMEMVAERIYDKTDGAIEIQCYGQGQLATYKDGLEQVANGANFISVEDPSYLADYVPDFKALVGPMLYDTYDEYVQMLQTDLVKDMIAKAEEKGIKVLGLDYIFGFRNLITNKVITTPDELKGLKLRVPGSNLFIDTINAMGATATGLPFAETLSGVAQGVVDGLEGSEFTNHGTKCYEYCKNVAMTKHFLGTCGVYISTDVWNSIPEKYQKIIAEEYTYGGKEMTQLITEAYEQTYEELEGFGVKFNDVDMDAFRAATKVVFDNMEANDGCTPGIYDALQAELTKMRG